MPAIMSPRRLSQGSARTALLIPAILVAALASTPAMSAQFSGDAAEGKRVAEFLCKNCHDVSGSERPKNPPGGAPAFFDVAQSPDTTVQSLQKFLRLPHGRMVNVLLSGKEFDNVVAYISSLKRK